MKRYSTQHSGQTLLEMLVVVLSIAALVGFTYAMYKHRANETIYDVIRGTSCTTTDGQSGAC